MSLGRCSLLELQAASERLESHVSRYEKKMKDKLDGEIKFGGLEPLVPEELVESLANFRGRAPGSRDVRGGEIRPENP